MNAPAASPSTTQSTFHTFPAEGTSLPEKAAKFLADLLEKQVVDAVGVPCWTSPTMATYQLVAQPAALSAADPFAPVILRNIAEQLAELTRQGLPKPVAFVVRSCEMRALIELAKLKQANIENVILIGADCLGTVPVTTMNQGGREFSQKLLTEPLAAEALRTACKLCDLRVPPAGDLNLCALGGDAGGPLVIEAKTEAGRKAMETLGLSETAAPDGRAGAVEAAARAGRERLEQADATDLLQHLSRCSRCYNCRNMCPICYCPECFFTPAKMGYSSEKYLDWASRKGSLQFPTDVLLFHLTRMNHMMTSCVGCGICESVCPNHIPLGRIYSVLRRKVQAQFNYEAGRSLDEPLPVAVFYEHELENVEE